jgi:hypothetical protein
MRSRYYPLPRSPKRSAGALLAVLPFAWRRTAVYDRETVTIKPER